MAKQIILGSLLSLFLTFGFWKITGLVTFNRQIDDILFLSCPILAIATSVWIVRSKYGPMPPGDQD